MYNPNAWANEWDKHNPTKFKEECEKSGALQYEYQKNYENKMKELQKIKDLQPKEKK